MNVVPKIAKAILSKLAEDKKYGIGEVEPKMFDLDNATFNGQIEALREAEMIEFVGDTTYESYPFKLAILEAGEKYLNPPPTITSGPLSF